MKNALENIQKRMSVRVYADKPVNDKVKEKLRSLFAENERGPFGNTVRLMLLDFDAMNREERRGLGTYGIIKGARLFILGAVKESKRALEDLGYCMEKVILEATALGLGTCWVGGTFRRSRFAAWMQLPAGELLPAITPVGYPAEQVTLAARMLRYGAGSRRRKPWSELFFASDGKTPLAKAEAGDYREALEAVRLGPSAANRQPWRFFKGEAGLYHLFLSESRLYNRALGQIQLQYVDMGIAMCHFELAAGQHGCTGRWEAAVPGMAVPGLEYISTWAPLER